MRLRISKLKRDSTLQVCADMNPDVIQAYAEKMQAGDAMPLPTVFYDGTSYWLADGYCRVAAAVTLGIAELDVDVKMGDRRDAIEWAFRAKARQAARPTRADKRRAVETALEAEPEMSSNAIAKRVGVTNKTVDSVRSTLGISQPARRTGLDSKSYPTSKPRD